VIAGVDVSSKAVHFAVISDLGTPLTMHRFKIAGSPPHPEFEAAHNVGYEFSQVGPYFWDHVWLLGIENTYSRGFGAGNQLKMVTGAVLACVPWNVTVVPTTANEWQKLFVFDGVGKLPARSKDRKPLIREAANSRFPGQLDDDFWRDQDAIDALGIAWAVMQLNQRALEKAA
jgi:hypothetical protein